jgi:elongation factor 1-gamma
MTVHSQSRFALCVSIRTAKATADMKAALQVLQDHLAGNKNYLVNDQLTLADIVLVSTLVYPFKLACDETFLEPYGNVVRWFTTCIQRSEFQTVLGPVEICKEPTKPAAK